MIEFTLDLGNSHWERGRHSLLFTHSSRTGASQIIVPLPSALSPDLKRIRQTGNSRSPAILKIPNNPVNPASDNVHQEIRDRPSPRGASQIIVPLQSALSIHAKRIRSTGINRSPAILKIPNNPVNPASDNVHQEIRDRPRLQWRIPNNRPSAICPFTPRKKDPLNRHQPIACNPENPQ